VKFGISFTVTHLNQAGALVLLYQDGTAQVNHGGTEMGQGLHTNVAAIAARGLGLRPEHVRVMPTSTDKIPNTSATAASSGTDLNGAAVKECCEFRCASWLRWRPFQEKNGRAGGQQPLLATAWSATAAAAVHRELRGSAGRLTRAHQLVGDRLLCHAGDSLGPRCWAG
jgi:hypothetical protein